MKRTRIEDGFWAPRQQLMLDTALPHMENILRDKVPGAEKSHAIMNFRVAAGQDQGEFYGMVFQDSDVAKWLEAASYSLTIRYDAELDRRMDDLIETIRLAQDKDGYLDTYFTLVEPEHRFQNLLSCHELYCAGHMMEAGAAHYESTGKRTLLDVALRLADHIISVFGEGRREGVPGHQEVEIGLMRLYFVTGDEKYKDMAARFLMLRGHVAPAAPETDKKYGEYRISPEDKAYNQTDVPVLAQTHPRGHAVRQMYMLTAMAQVAYANHDREMENVCARMVDEIVDGYMYVTGALGSTSQGEAFSVRYDLPTDTVYGETCASVAMAFFMRAMLKMRKSGKYADLLELELYNGALAGMQLDGKQYFYVNPLDVDPAIAGKAKGHEHVLPTRPKWYGCACCPPNLARLITSLGDYVWDEEGETVYNHLFVGSTYRGDMADVTLETGYPMDGGARYTVTPHQDAFTLAIHIPYFVKELDVFVNGEQTDGRMQDGYLFVKRSWQKGDCVTLSFSLTPRLLYGSAKVRDNAGRAAVMMGPMVFCAEGVDNPVLLHALILSGNIEKTRDERGMVTLKAEGLRELPAQMGQKPELTRVSIRLIPYFAWGNRGENSMLVWLRCTP